MAKQVWISEEAFEYVKKIQLELLELNGYEISLTQLISKAILNNVELK